MCSSDLQFADVGCGNGRYALPVMRAGGCELVGCDLSRNALDAFARRLHEASDERDVPDPARLALVLGGPEALPAGPPFDRFMMLFGVLSHIGPRAGRVDALRELRQRASADAQLLLSVPSLWRRRPLELLASLARRGGDTLGDVRFTRLIAGRPQTFYYHLYTLRGLREELAEAGWRLVHVEAESLAPEWLITRFAACEWLDRRLQARLPAALGYGIRAVARPAEAGP